MIKTEVHVWYGDSNRTPLGPIAGIMIEHNPQGDSKIEITDKQWKDDTGFDDEPYFCTCKHLPADCFLSYDAYAWCYPGECDLETKWW